MKLIANDYGCGDIIRIIREWTELKQVDFAKSINKSSRSLQDYEAGRTNYSVKMLLDIAEKYGLEIIIRKK